MTKAHKVTGFRSATAGLLTWLGGGDQCERAGRDDRSAHAAAGVVVLLGATFAWLVASAAVRESASWPTAAVPPFTVLFGLLVGAVTRAAAGAPDRRRGLVGRAAVAVAIGVVVGELGALVVFSRSIDHRLEERALRDAGSMPAVAQASASLQQTEYARAALDTAVEQARDRQDKALVVARCEYRPTPACPPTRITGVPGSGPETRTANRLLADAQHHLDDALAARDQRAPELDATIARERRSLTEARGNVLAGARRGLGARWTAMHDLTLAGAGVLALRLATIAACVLLYLLPLILALWRGTTSHDRRASARAARERAEIDADTAIAVRQAEVRREAAILWAEHRLTQARLAVEAQLEIDREQQRRRVREALEDCVHASSQRGSEPPGEETYLPIAAEAGAAGRAVAELPAAADAPGPQNLPAHVQAPGDAQPHAPLLPSLPDATRAAARWIRPLVPPFVARAIDNTTQPLRAARQVLEEVEEITFSLRRTRKVTINSESSDTPLSAGRVSPSGGERSRDPGCQDASGYPRHTSSGEVPTAGGPGRSLGSAERDGRLELMERDGPRRLGAPEGPRQLPPAG